MNLSKICSILTISTATMFATVLPSAGSLLGANPTFPKVTYQNTSASALTYNSTNQLLTINGSPSAIKFSSAELPLIVTGVKSLQIKAVVDNAGVLVGGVTGDDFVLSGTVKRIVGSVTNVYTGVLLTGEVMAFGSLESGATDQYDLRFTPTGGALLAFFSCGQISVQVTSEASTFTGSFAANFNGRGKGNVGSEDITPPSITCPTNITVESHTGTNAICGAYVTYPTPVVTDNCDPNPTIISTPPSGSIFLLPPGVSTTNYVVTCVAQDAAGNTNVCSFTITVQDTLPPVFSDPNNPLVTCSGIPIVLTNDPGKCHATFTFPRPFATDNCCPLIIPANVSAVDQNGVTIVLTDIGNNILQGVFPVNVSGSNVITVTASDGRGNSTQCQTSVVVVDRDPPTLFCLDQTGTFKPILTNALSCIEADFDDTCIRKSNIVWFSSVIKIPSCSYTGPVTVHIFNQSIELAMDGTNITLQVPEAFITLSNGVTTSTTTFTNGVWITLTKRGLSGNIFAAAVAWQVPFDLNNNNHTWGSRNWRDKDEWFCKRRRVNSATWCARFAVDNPNVVVKWQWSAAVHTSFTNDYNALCVKPCDDNNDSYWKNSDHAGACENYKKYAIKGARGKGRCDKDRDGNDRSDCTGVLSDSKRANLGLGTICLGAVEFNPPAAFDNCGSPVSVTTSPEPGSIFGPGVYPITATATDASGNTNQCTFNLTVLAPLQVVIDSPLNDNLNDNTSEPDTGFSDMNCPDDPSTPQIVTRFSSGEKIYHSVRLIDCNGNDVTAAVGPYVTVHIDVTERQGTYDTSVLVNDVPQNYSCVGSPGGIMVLNCGKFGFNLDTTGFETGTMNNNKFFRSCVWVDYNSSPGVPVGMEDVILDSH